MQLQIYRYRCGGHRGQAHPRSQYSLLPTRHLLIYTESDSWMEWLVEKFHSVCGCDAQWVQQGSGWEYTVCTRRSGTYACVSCVRNYIPTTTTAETTLVTPTWSKHAPSADVIRHATRRGTFNTAGATARFVFHAEPRRYSRSAFLAWKARLVVRADSLLWRTSHRTRRNFTT